MKSIRGLLLLPVVTVCTAVYAQEKQKPDTAGSPQKAITFKEPVTKELKLNYLLSLPDGYETEPEKKWPLVVFLHGAGERGDNLEQVKIHGPPMLVEQGKKFPFILISPQCPKDSWWPYEPVLELIDHAEEKYRVDSNRIILTGLSMGGYGTWHLASRAPDRFAAIVPICGGGTPYLMRRLAHLPVWVFHGAKDTAVPFVESERLVAALERAKNTRTKFTVYPEAGHNSWTEAYNLQELYDWMMAQDRSKNVN